MLILSLRITCFGALVKHATSAGGGQKVHHLVCLSLAQGSQDARILLIFIAMQSSAPCSPCSFFLWGGGVKGWIFLLKEAPPVCPASLDRRKMKIPSARRKRAGLARGEVTRKARRPRHGSSVQTIGAKMVDPEPCKEPRRRLQLFMAGIVPY